MRYHFLSHNLKGNSLNKYVTGVLVAVVFLTSFVPGFSQDSLFNVRAQKDFHELKTLNKHFTDNLSFNRTKNLEFPEAFKKLEWRIFPQEQKNAKHYFLYLKSLSEEDQQNLLLQFAKYELLIEDELKKNNLPVELKFLPAALSFLNPKFVGNYGSAGLWRLTHMQAVLNGLNVSRLIDERVDVSLSTEAAIKLLKQNIGLFKSEELGVLAFVAGNTQLRNSFEKSDKSPNVQELLKVLPDEVSEKISLFQAFGVFFNEYKIQNKLFLQEPDTVEVTRQVHLNQVAGVLNIPLAKLIQLNPQYRYAILPGDQAACKLLLPAGKKNDFIFSLDSVYSVVDSSLFEIVAQNIEYPPAPNRQYLGEKVKDLEIEGKTKIKYTIKSGDVLGFIAEDYNVRVADLKYWNNIYNERRIQAGKQLDIFVDDDKAEYYKSLQAKSKAKSKPVNYAAKLTESALPSYKIPETAKKIQHTVKRGESPYVIAKKYTGVTPEAILEWNGITDARKIQIGQKLTIYLEQ